MKIVLCRILIFLLITGSDGFGKQGPLKFVDSHFTQYSVTVPVLKNKVNNPVLRLTIKSTQPNEVLRKLDISLSGTSNLKDIKAVRVFYYGADSVSGNMQSVAAPLFGSTQRVDKAISITGNQRLIPGDNHFWIAVELSNEANLINRISVKGTKVHTSNDVLTARDATVEPLRMGVAVRQHRQDGVHSSRIPGLATSKKGTLLAVFDARYESGRDLQGHMDIGLHRSTDGGNTWKPIQIVMDMGEWGGLPQKFNGVSDACILVDEKSGDIYIAGLWMYGVINGEGKWLEGLSQNDTRWNHQWRDKGSQPGLGVKQTSQFLIIKSTDDGLTWSEPVNITSACKRPEWWLWAPAPGAGITTKNGTLVFPTQGRDKNGTPFSNITYSAGGGTTWKTSNAALDIPKGTTECAVVELLDGSLMLNMRTNKNAGVVGTTNGRSVAVTHNLGESWEEHASSQNALPEPVCMASLYKFEDPILNRRFLLFSNPNSKVSRDSITIKASFDDGISWPENDWVLLDALKGRGYSCITAVDSNHIGILYESSQADMVFQKIPITPWIRKK
jgi:sialidase-1